MAAACKVPVLIAGAGPAGLTLSLYLSLYGMAVHAHTCTHMHACMHAACMPNTHLSARMHTACLCEYLQVA